MINAFEFIVQTMGFEGLARCVHERKKYQKHIKNDTNIHPQINDKSMQNLCSKKECTKHRKSSYMESKREPKTIKKTFQNRSQNLVRQK